MTSDDVRRAIAKLRADNAPSEETCYTANIHRDWIEKAIANPKGPEADFLFYLADIGMLKFDKQAGYVANWDDVCWYPEKPKKP